MDPIRPFSLISETSAVIAIAGIGKLTSGFGQ
jgi:hypothetical protein